VGQSLHHGSECRLFLVICGRPAEPHPERNEIGAHARHSLRSDPPSRSVIAAMPLGIGGRERRFADTAKPVQRRDGDPTIMASERRRDLRERVVAAHEMHRHPDGDIGHRGNWHGRSRTARERRPSSSIR
jgi:hypothetical protein